MNANIRYSCGHQFPPELRGRLHDFFYEILARAIVRAEAEACGAATADIVAQTINGMREECLNLFHTWCDTELLCPKCGKLHMPPDVFSRLLNAEFTECMVHFDQNRLRNVMASVRYPV